MVFGNGPEDVDPGQGSRTWWIPPECVAEGSSDLWRLGEIASLRRVDVGERYQVFIRRIVGDELR